MTTRGEPQAPPPPHARLLARLRGLALELGERSLVAEVRLVGLQQALHDLAAEEVLVDDLGDVVDGDVRVPDLLRVDDDADAVLALVEAAGIVRPHDLGDAARCELGLELVADLHASLGLAAPLGVVGRALVDADEDVALKARHLSTQGYHAYRCLPSPGVATGLGSAHPRRVIGSVLGKYRIEAELSRGGMGAVYRARHEIIDRTVALKVLRPELSEDPDLVTRFLNEAKAASAINHPSIIDVHDFGYTDDGQAYLVMELLDGESLAQRLARRRRLPSAEAVTIARSIAGALSAAHAKGIVHRDLKPDNIFLISDPDLGERAKVLDFGVAKLLEAAHQTQHTQTGALMGTPLYMAPEQARAASAIDERADLYSLGCILYELLVGEPPFKGVGAGEIITMQMFETPVPPSARVDGIAPALEHAVLRLLEKEPADRFATAAETSAALAAAAASAPARAPAPMTNATHVAVAAHSLVPGAAASTRSMLPWISAGVMLVVGAIVVVLVMSGGPQAKAPVPVAPAPPAPIIRPTLVTPLEPVVPTVVPVTPVADTPVSGPPTPARQKRPKRLPVTDKGSPIEPSLD
jgi:tRNA A-37 threonylcarbamoyl transferase component Bud32